jgi:type II secretory pathway pseudopilin PulG
MVIVLISILAAVATPRLGNLGSYDLLRAGHDLLEAIRFAQQQSMIHSGADPFQIVISGGGYSVTQNGTAITNPLTGTLGYSADGTEWSGVNVTGGQTIRFNGVGKPTCSDTACSAPSDGPVVINLTKGSESATLTIEQFTGYAHLD